MVTYSSAVKASSNGQEWQLAMQLLRSMLQEWLAPDVTTYSFAINPCNDAGEWQLAMQQGVPDAGCDHLQFHHQSFR